MKPFAVIKTGGKQYQVSEGQELLIEIQPGKNEGDTLELPVLAAHNGTELLLGTPMLSQAATATVLAEKRGKKVLVYRKKRRSTFKKKNGHRQTYFRIRIESIPSN
ncbi:MAG: 50S ribosomal protein L21 [Acidobacteria bacterium]|nr:50S ribosomal protein L21 [Acidobacteriota bacterium]MCB9398070.1 50S ribosomal protein L21 [Acidobacteriota bacterium]